MKKIVVLGAGYAGILTAKKLAKRTKKMRDVEITIIDKNPFHTMLTELHEVAAWRVEEDSIKISLERVFARRKVNVVHDNVTGIDFGKKSVAGENGSYGYDYLVLASGSKPAFFNVPGAKENTFTLWSYEDAVKIREHVMDMFRAASTEPRLEKKRELLTFFVVGAGFTGVEMMGELAELVPSLCDRFEIDPKLVSMCDVDMLDRVCTVLPEKVSKKVQRRLEKMRVNVMLKTNIKGVGEDYIEYEAAGKLQRAKTRTVIWTAGIEGSDIAYASGTVGEAGRGRVQTNEYLCAKNDKNVYVAGDNIFYVPENQKNPVPQMVENAEASADTVAHNLLCDIKGSGEKEKYKPKFHGVMVCVGGRYGAAHIGSEKSKMALPSFLAMFCKHFVNLIYFVQVLGWNKIFSYLKHEFFTVRNRRSFVGGHFSNRGPSFFAVPLRIWLGIYWVYEGIAKIGEDWLKSPKLAGFFNGANQWYDSILNGAAGTAAASGAADTAAAASGAADAAASASGAVAGAAASVGEALINWNIFGFIRILLVSAGEVAFKVQVSLADWFIDTFVLPSDGMQVFMQTTIVIAEILIGLALIGGLFTTPAGVGSLVLQFMFLSTTGLYMTGWWMIPASIAVLFGAGQVFSLDYYVIPFLKRKWKKARLARKWYLYND